MFGAKHLEENEKLRAEVDRLAGLSLPQLAAGADGEGVRPRRARGRWQARRAQLDRGRPEPAEGSFLDDNLLLEHFGVVAEGPQLLEHAGLVRFEVFSNGGIADWTWTATRAGATALQQNAAASLLEQRTALGAS